MQVAAALAEGGVVDERAIPENHPIWRMQGQSAGATASGAHAPARAADAQPSSGERILIDGANAYDPAKSWHDYERMIIARCYEANGFRARATAEELGLSIATLYNRVREWNLDDRSSQIYAEPFAYARGTTVEAFLPKLFSAALAAVGGKPTLAIANLRVSQGYFYKVMKKSETRDSGPGIRKG